MDVEQAVNLNIRSVFWQIYDFALDGICFAMLFVYLPFVSVFCWVLACVLVRISELFARSIAPSSPGLEIIECLVTFTYESCCLHLATVYSDLSNEGCSPAAFELAGFGPLVFFASGWLTGVKFRPRIVCAEWTIYYTILIALVWRRRKSCHFLSSNLMNSSLGSKLCGVWIFFIFMTAGMVWMQLPLRKVLSVGALRVSDLLKRARQAGKHHAARGNMEVPATLTGRTHLAWQTSPMDMAATLDTIAIPGTCEPANPEDSGDETSVTVDLDIDVSSFRHIHASHFRHRRELPMAAGLTNDDQYFVDIDDIFIGALDAVPQTPCGMETFKVTVRMLTGDVVLEFDTCDVCIGEMKKRILEERGVELDAQQLSIDSRDYPAQDSEMLHDLIAPDSRNLSLYLTVTDHEHIRGPFSLAQDHTWGVWEGMSNDPGILDVYQGRWKAPSVFKQQLLHIWQDERYLSIEISSDIAKDKVGNSIPMEIRNGHVFLWGMRSVCRQCTRPPNVGRMVLQVMSEANRCVHVLVRRDVRN